MESPLPTTTSWPTVVIDGDYQLTRSTLSNGNECLITDHRTSSASDSDGLANESHHHHHYHQLAHQQENDINFRFEQQPMPVGLLMHDSEANHHTDSSTIELDSEIFYQVSSKAVATMAVNDDGQPITTNNSSPNELKFDQNANQIDENLSEKPSKGELPERGQWSGQLDFIFSCISYAVGLGNVWRFPYLCYENGGGAFVVPYLICVLVVGVPLFLMEVSLGQYFQAGGVAIWNRIPIFKGVGFASMVMIGLCNTYYIVIIAWTLYYLFNSFKNPLPWSECNNWWNSDSCYSANVTSTTNTSISSAQEYWENRVLTISDDMLNVGSIQWELFVSLIVGWILVYGVIYRGIHQSGKIIWFTAIFPYVILFTLFCYGMSLEGAMSGIAFYIMPKWHMLAESKIWVAAGTQLLFTYGIGIGTNIALGSYNTHNHNFYRDSLIACLLSSGTSLFSGFVIFSVLGHMAHTMHTTVDAVVSSGPGLAFIVYPEAVAKLPLSQLWAILFFMMLLVLGIDSQFCTVESFVTGIVDEYPRLLRPHRKLFTALIVVVHFILGISMITSGGMYIFQLMDNYSASGISLIIVVICEIIGFAWIYGGEKIYRNMIEMLGFKPNRILYYLWLYISPAVLVAILLFSIIQYKPPTYARKPFPWYGEMFGWTIAMSSIFCIPFYLLYYLFFKSNPKLSLKERFTEGLRSKSDLPVIAGQKSNTTTNNGVKVDSCRRFDELESSCSDSTLSTSVTDQNLP